MIALEYVQSPKAFFYIDPGFDTATLGMIGANLGKVKIKSLMF